MYYQVSRGKLKKLYSLSILKPEFESTSYFFALRNNVLLYHHIIIRLFDPKN